MPLCARNARVGEHIEAPERAESSEEPPFSSSSIIRGTLSSTNCERTAAQHNFFSACEWAIKRGGTARREEMRQGELPRACAERIVSHTSRQPIIDAGKREMAGVPAKQKRTRRQRSIDKPPPKT